MVDVNFEAGRRLWFPEQYDIPGIVAISIRIPAKQIRKFVGAAGVSTHYLGDAGQPLHISYLHDGDPEQPVTSTVNHRGGTSENKAEALGSGVHSAYEDNMVSAVCEAIFTGFAKTPTVKVNELVTTGFDAQGV